MNNNKKLEFLKDLRNLLIKHECWMYGGSFSDGWADAGFEDNIDLLFEIDDYSIEAEDITKLINQWDRQN